MRVSCVICSHDRVSVYNTIDSVLKQSHPVEVIVIDDGSLRPIHAKDTSVKLIHNPSPRGLSYCRNLGLEIAQGEVVAFIDDDAYAAKNWIQELVLCFQAGADIAGGLIKPVWSHTPPWWLKSWMYHLLGVNTHLRAVLGCNFAIRRSLPKELGYFFEERLGRKRDNLIAGDETTMFEVAEERNCKIMFNERAVVYHLVTKERLRLKYFTRRVLWEGRTERRRKKAKRYLYVWLTMAIAPTINTIRHPSYEGLQESLASFIFISAYIIGIIWESLFGVTDY